MSTPNPATTPWVPMWNLNGGVALTYFGDYVAGTYKDGDIVVYNGVAYMCVRPTSAPPAAWPRSQAVSSYGTTLPASPYDGQEAVLVDSLTAPTYQWRFRYNAGSTSAYKWEFVGGSPIFVGGSTPNFTTPSGPTGWLDGNGPSVSVPRAGTYEFFWGVSWTLVNGTGLSGMMGVTGPGMPVPNQWYFNNSTPATAAMKWVGTITAAGTVKAQYQANGAGTATFVQPYISVLPVRVA